jgi:hypothetical protein
LSELEEERIRDDIYACFRNEHLSTLLYNNSNNVCMLFSSVDELSFSRGDVIKFFPYNAKASALKNPSEKNEKQQMHIKNSSPCVHFESQEFLLQR